MRFGSMVLRFRIAKHFLLHFIFPSLLYLIFLLATILRFEFQLLTVASALFLTFRQFILMRLNSYFYERNYNFLQQKQRL